MFFKHLKNRFKITGFNEFHKFLNFGKSFDSCQISPFSEPVTVFHGKPHQILIKIVFLNAIVYRCK